MKYAEWGAAELQTMGLRNMYADWTADREEFDEAYQQRDEMAIAERAITDAYHYQRRQREWALKKGRWNTAYLRAACKNVLARAEQAEAAVDRLQRALRAAETELEQLRLVEARLRKSWREDTDREKQRTEQAEAERDKLQADATFLDECVDGMIADREYFEELARKAEANLEACRRTRDKLMEQVAGRADKAEAERDGVVEANSKLLLTLEQAEVELDRMDKMAAALRDDELVTWAVGCACGQKGWETIATSAVESYRAGLKQRSALLCPEEER